MHGEQVMLEDEPSYRGLRKLWKDIRDFTAGLIPARGVPCTAELKLQFPD